MSKTSSGGAGIVAGLLLVVVIIICGAFLGFRGSEDCDAEDRRNNEKECVQPTPSVDRSMIIAPQKTKGARK